LATRNTDFNKQLSPFINAQVAVVMKIVIIVNNVTDNFPILLPATKMVWLKLKVLA